MPTALTGMIPARMCVRLSIPAAHISSIHCANFPTSYTACVCMKSAPALTFLSSLAARVLDRLDELHRVDVEDDLGLGMVAEFHVVAREAEEVSHAERHRPAHV